MFETCCASSQSGCLPPCTCCRSCGWGRQRQVRKHARSCCSSLGHLSGSVPEQHASVSSVVGLRSVPTGPYTGRAFGILMDSEALRQPTSHTLPESLGSCSTAVLLNNGTLRYHSHEFAVQTLHCCGKCYERGGLMCSCVSQTPTLQMVSTTTCRYKKCSAHDQGPWRHASGRKPGSVL